MYKAQLKRVCATRRALRAHQDQLHTMELEGVLSITLSSLTNSLSLPISAATASALVDVLREALRSRNKELKLQTRTLRQDLAESQELAARDAALLRAAKKNGGDLSTPTV